jgi:hypothetical protein
MPECKFGLVNIYDMGSAHEILVGKNLQETDHGVAWRRREVDVRIRDEKREIYT